MNHEDTGVSDSTSLSVPPWFETGAVIVPALLAHLNPSACSSLPSIAAQRRMTFTYQPTGRYQFAIPDIFPITGYL